MGRSCPTAASVLTGLMLEGSSRCFCTISMTRNLLMNALFLIATYAVWTGATALKDPDFQEIVQKHRLDPSSINPVNTLAAVGQLLPIKPGIF